jgi:2-dehydro-3-deoxygluconokinase
MVTAAARPPRVLTVGETMALLDPHEDGPPAAGSTWTLRAAGAESNFAIGLARLGVRVTWVSRLGADPLGDAVYDELERQGVDLSLVRRDVSAPTGIYLKWRESGGGRVHYHRAGSAASRLEPADVPDAALAAAGHVHLTGITMAISDSARRLVIDLAARARRAGIGVSFDPNFRAALWESPEAAGAGMCEVLPYVDWVLCGEQEGCLVFGAAEGEGLVAVLRDAGAHDAVLRIGARGARVTVGDRLETVPPQRREHVVDEVGAGDAFAAGFVYGLLAGASPVECARTGNLIAARALSGTGDWETLPRLADVRGELPTPRGRPRRETITTEKEPNT